MAKIIPLHSKSVTYQGDGIPGAGSTIYHGRTLCLMFAKWLAKAGELEHDMDFTLEKLVDDFWTELQSE